MNGKKLDSDYKKLNDQLDILNSKMELADEREKVDLYEQQLDLLNQQVKKQEEINSNNQSQMIFYRDYLKSKGFQFDSNGNMINGAEQLNNVANSQDPELESVKDAYENYLELQDEVSEGTADWWALQAEIKKTKDEIDALHEAEKKMFEDMAKMVKESGVQELTDQYDALNRKLSLIEEKMDGARGVNKRKYLEEELLILNKQVEKQEQLLNLYEKDAVAQRQQLENWGLIFDEMGQIQNLDEVMSAQTTLENMEKLKELVDEYVELQNGDLADSNKEWVELNNQIQEVRDSILELQIELDKLRLDSIETTLQGEVDRIESLIDLNKSKQELAGADTNALYEKRLDLIKQLQQANQDLLDSQKNYQNELKNTLEDEYGFTIDDNGSIVNTTERLESLKDTLSETEFDYVQDMVDEYTDLSTKSIYDIEKELIDLQKEYEKVQNEKLKATEQVEKAITDMVKDEVDARKKKIKEESEARQTELKKAQEEYKKYRDEVSYKDDYNEQLEKLNKLDQDIAIARRDTSLSGQKRLEELLEDRQEQQKKLEELVQKKLDDDINNAFNDEIDRVKQNEEAQIKALEDMFSETKIAQIVKESISTGLYEDLEGNIVSLDEALLDMTMNTEKYLGVMGNSLRKELLSNLDIALETMKELDQIYKDMDMIDYSNYSDAVSTQADNPAEATEQTVNNTTNNITVEGTTINIEGNADEKTLQAMQEMLDNQKEEIVEEVTDEILKNAN